MATKLIRVAGYIPHDLYQRLQSYRTRHGITTDSKALIAVFEAVLGTEDQKPAFTRMSDLEQRVEALEQELQLIRAEQTARKSC